MMTCDEAIRVLLEADRAELSADPGTDLGRHLASCDRCRRAAERLEAGTAALDGWLDRPPPAIDASRVVDEAMASRSRSRRVLAGLRWGAPLAAAAAIAGLLLLEGPGDPLPGEPLTPEDRRSELALEIPAGRNAAVLATTDPDITVVWFYGGD